LSRITAIMAPNIIRKPVEAIVLPKLSFIIWITFLPGITAIARKRDTRKREIKAFSFHFEVNKIMAEILIRTRIDIAVMPMILFKTCNDLKRKFHGISLSHHFIKIIYPFRK